jgi:hypothetical protein
VTAQLTRKTGHGHVQEPNQDGSGAYGRVAITTNPFVRAGQRRLLRSEFLLHS